MSFPKHTGGGFYRLSDGTKMRGKQAAIRAQMGIVAKEKELAPKPARTVLKPAVPVKFEPPKPKPPKRQLSCPRCKSTVLHAIRSHEVRSADNAKWLPRIYECVPCGKRWPLR